MQRDYPRFGVDNIPKAERNLHKIILVTALTLTAGNDYSALSMAYTQADLDMANRHIFEAERHILRQEAIVTDLRTKGADTRLAEEVLAQFQSSLRMHRDDRDMIARELGQST